MLANGLTAAPTLIEVLRQMEGVRIRRRPRCRPGTPPSPAPCAPPMPTAWPAWAMPNPQAAESCTTHLTTTDKNGMMVAMTTTLLSSMGSRVVLPGTGVLMNNGIMWFDPRPEARNAIAPAKRPLCNMCPVIAVRDGVPEIATGASGGRRIMAAVFQLLSYVADFGMDPEEAAHHPRLDVSGPTGVTADRRLGPEILAALAADAPVTEVNHDVLPVNFACPNLIQRGPHGAVGITDAMSPWSAAIAA